MGAAKEWLVQLTVLDRRLSLVGVVLLIATLALAPLPYGSNQVLGESVLCLVAGVATLLGLGTTASSIAALPRSAFEELTRLMVIGLAIGAWTVVQVWPIAVLADGNPLRISAQEALPSV